MTNPLCKVIQSKNLSQCCCPQKERHPLENLHKPNTFLRKRNNSSSLNLLIKSPGIKYSIPLKTLSHLIHPLLIGA